ncbi:class I SAM-dependent methyltransferase [Candidatus Shapirobacteria bacterium CG08_land_8_20_14_0_20_39_18]|uniref:Class I SAM-dependent methyltransferase n=1 Tax=Candidatus Shapirobacteria bacterium CG08_land_8_20_14_0_20_39_18 TaxID=1974883 RepID=A0A2M6XDT1_9BACT|nr:MAG: class I SAM-dependent methyltransferase [Candidatus Shapirobacteria bacterium CG08_land_8_20_14_0_20_39_18]PJE68530.1 MAG: class I SAM-dependent methyltransferase [Candidatus Shapirobacteria bacterium CG10_big_fil_rev_8_21_14_0_10_38_8]
MKQFFINNFNNAVQKNKNNILDLLKYNESAKLLDLGCDNGDWTKHLAQKIGTKSVYGIDINKQRYEVARKNGIIVKRGDLNNNFPFPKRFFDVVHSNQVIEHLYDTEKFIQEIYRVLKPSGYAIISTENLASWHNIFPLFFGWQPFSLTNISDHKLGVGNPLALHRNDELLSHSWQHIRVFSYQALKEIFEINNFRVEKILGAGYYPFFNQLAKLDPRHAGFLTLKLRKI